MKESQIELLSNLAIFKYMTSTHAIRLGICSHRNYMYSDIVPKLRDRRNPYIRRQQMTTIPQLGRLPDVYYLTKAGAKWLIENRILEADEIRYPVGTTDIATRDYIHRMATIDINIELKLWLDSIGGELCSSSGYFDRPGSQRKGEPLIVNKIELKNDVNLFPDLITHAQINGADKLFTWEQHNGKDTKKLMSQVQKHIEALKGKLIGQKLGINKLHRVGIVFEHKSILLASVQRLYEQYGDDTDLYKCFIFKTNEAMKDDFANDWLLWNNTITSITS